jgi:hypothetical protein
MRPGANVKAEYRVDSVADGIIHITDLNGSRSVTNDAEAVVAELFRQYGNQRIFYVDSCGDTDELWHENGAFRGFAPGPDELNPRRVARKSASRAAIG